MENYRLINKPMSAFLHERLVLKQQKPTWYNPEDCLQMNFGLKIDELYTPQAGRVFK